jgi:hypothetical protein
MKTVGAAALSRARVVASSLSSLITHHSSLLRFAANILATMAALLLLLDCSLLLFRNALVDGQIYYRSDTVLYYFPLADLLAEVLRQGRLMLWTPYLFGGFPLFADGEGGMLYPPNMIAYLLLSSADAMTWLRIARYFMAASFTYAYLRTLRVNRFAAIVGAMSFAFGSFMVGQMPHTNVGNTAIWLPLILCMVELSVQNVRRRRWLYATGAGAIMGIQALGLHIQPLIMTGFFLSLYVPFRVLLCPISWPARRGGQATGNRGKETEDQSLPLPLSAVEMEGNGHRGAGLAGRVLGPLARFARRSLASTFHRAILTGLLLGFIPAIAFGIAAVQVLPLVELGFFSFRGQGVNYQFATSYSLPVQNLVNLVFPYFFRYTNQQYYWSLWTEWETTLYAGIAPLILATIAVLFVRRRLMLFFVAMVLVSLVLAFGGYSPYPLWGEIRSLPGLSSLRVPARFTMLTTFSLGVLAAFGTDWLCRTLRPQIRPDKRRWSRLSRIVGINGFAVYLMGLLSAIAGVVWWLVSFRAWTEKDPTAVKSAVQATYLSLRNDRPWLTPDAALNFLRYSLDPTNPSTARSLALMLATLLLLFAWYAFRGLWRVWASVLVILVATDMLLFATDFHPTVSIGQLTTPNSATEWLMARNSDGLERVYTTPGARKTEANRLLPFKLSEIAGYSSLETKRHQDYMAKLSEDEKPFLDLYGARYVVTTRNPVALPSFRYVAYHPTRPLADGPSSGQNAQVTFYMSPPVKTDEVTFISNLRDAVDIPQDADVADIVVTDTSGARVTLKARAGRDTAEWAYDRPDVTPWVAHSRPEVADRQLVTDTDGSRFQANLYYGEIHLDRTRTVERVEFHYTYPRGKVRLYGMMLWENPSTAHQVLGRNRYIPRYEDDEVAILENPAALPRAYLVPAARVLKPTDILETIAHGDFDPQKTALLELPATSDSPLEGGAADPKTVEQWLQGGTGAQPGKAELLTYQSSEVVIRTSSDRNTLLFLADSYYPGWKARVDGQDAKIYRADYLFRAVPVPAGEHEVRFVFEPDTFDLGESISLFTLCTLLILWAGLLLAPTVWSAVRRLRLRRAA